MKIYSLLFIGLSVCFSWSHFSAFAAIPGTASTMSSRSAAEFKARMARDTKMLLEKKDLVQGGKTSALPSVAEQKLYDEMVAAFERNDELSFQSRFQKIRSDYPKSLHADESVYMAGMLALSNKSYGRAISRFTQIEKEFPRSNRLRAARYAKAAAYAKMNLKSQAQSIFRELTQKFPGSPEARRAEVDLKLIK